MLNLQNVSIKQFKQNLIGKKLFLFGAGRVLQSQIDVFCSGHKIQAIVDNNQALHGKNILIDEQTVPVISLDAFVQTVKSLNKKDIILWVTPVFYGLDVINQLDQIAELDGVQTYLTHLLRYYPTKPQPCTFTTATQNLIPKKIHYMWIGGKTMPAHLQKFVDDWKKLCPDYEIICWNESNYDFGKNLYMKQAYEQKSWGHVPDYARLDIIYEHGGIYLDTDVELIKKPDCLLNDGAFFGMAYCGINLGCGFGAKPKHQFIKELRDYYDNVCFVNKDGTKNTAPCVAYQHPVFKKANFCFDDVYQKNGVIVVYPTDVLIDKGMLSGKNTQDVVTEQTVAVHHGQYSWCSNEEKMAFASICNNIKARLAQNAAYFANNANVESVSINRSGGGYKPLIKFAFNANNARSSCTRRAA